MGNYQSKRLAIMSRVYVPTDGIPTIWFGISNGGVCNVDPNNTQTASMNRTDINLGECVNVAAAISRHSSIGYYPVCYYLNGNLLKSSSTEGILTFDHTVSTEYYEGWCASVSAVSAFSGTKDSTILLNR